MAYFLLYGKSLLATDLKDTAECRASEKPFFAKFVRLMVRLSMALFVRKYRKKKNKSYQMPDELLISQ